MAERLTLFHRTYDPKTRTTGFQKSELWAYSLRMRCGQTEQHNPKRSLLLRLLPQEMGELAVGDFLVVGQTEATVPPKDSFLVQEVRDNRFGRLKHWKVVAE